MKPIYVKDGDDIIIISVLSPSVHDPILGYPGIAQGYRVVANSYGPTFELVKLKTEPTLLTKLPKEENL